MDYKIYLSAADICTILDISRTKAYAIIRQLNAELEKEGYITIAGKVSRKRFEERFYGGLVSG
jgi:prophage antirepressor-like protein